MQLETDEEQRELKNHGCYEFPVFISQEVLSRYERGAFIWHWHNEVELTYIVEGQISYQVNDRLHELHAGDGLFCNTNALHTGHMIDGQDCYYLSVTFHPRIIYGFEGSVIQRDYMNPLLKDAALGSIAFHPDTEWNRQILSAMEEIHGLYRKPSGAFEMKVQRQISFIWQKIYENLAQEGRKPDGTGTAGQGRDIERIRKILGFIQEHYMEKITLEDIAAQINICKSECCRFFKKYMQESLFDYLLYYRVEKSLPLLADHQLSVTEIAEATGFSSPGYFARVFKEQMKCSPSQYRSANR